MTTISGNYTIQKGDNLWNIVRNNYTKDGKTLSNSDIAGIVKKITKDNDNIKNANLIFAGDKIILGDYDGFELQIADETLEDTPKTTPAAGAKGEADTQESPETEDTPAQTGLYGDFNSWAAKNSEDFTSVDTTLSGTKQKEAFEEIESRTFSYNTEDTEESRKAGIEEMVAGQIEKYDTDGDGAINLKEYLTGEVAEYNDAANGAIAKITEEEIDKFLNTDKDKLTENEVNELLSELERVFDFFNFNGNSTLDKNELTAYYNILDTSVDKVQDGKFDYATYVYWNDLAGAGEGDTLEASRKNRKEALDASYKQAHPEEF